MHPSVQFSTARRLARLPLALGLLLAVAALAAWSTPDAAAVEPASDWIDLVDAPNRMLFDSPTSNDGAALIHALNYLNSWNAAGVSDEEIDAVITFYGATTFHGLEDAMWERYGLGEVMGEHDLVGTPFTTNPWRTSPIVDGGALPVASIESLAGRGATFLLCNNALTFLAGKVAAARGLDADAVYADMQAHILPDVTLVPAMVVALDRAQQAGISYHRQ